MHAEPPPSRWSSERFGECAVPVRRAVAEAVLEAIENARDAQGSSGTGKQHPFGFTLMARKFETLGRSFTDMPGVAAIRPAGSMHELTVVSGNLLFPFEFAKDRSTNVMKAQIGGTAKVSGLLKILFRRFGPEPSMVQLALDTGDDGETRRLEAVADSLARLPEGTRLVLIAYACNSQAGLLELWWGEAELLDEHGRLRWIHCEEIPFRKAPPSGGQLPGSGSGPGDLPSSPKFDEGPMPTPPLNARPAVEVKNQDAFPPRTETETPTQGVADDEGH